MSFLIPALSDLDDEMLRARLRHVLDNKTKPVGSLGVLEHLAERLGLILGSDAPELREPQLVVFAADHGLTAHGVSAFPGDVTRQMVENFLSGGAAVSVLARLHGVALTVADCGVRGEFAARAGLRDLKIAPGTADALNGPAMTEAQRDAALANGQALVASLPGNVLLLGEMGIGNTSAAALLLARLTGQDVADCAGAGTGLDPAGLAHKVAVLRQVLARHESAIAPLDALAALGGFEIATMVGAVLQAAAENRVIVVDGFITGAAVLVASRLAPRVLQRCVHAHRSAERGHGLMLAALGGDPLLDWHLRLGEGSGAALAWPLMQSACAILRDMASFDDAGVSRETQH